jgi:hypothetical protein
LAFFKHQRLPGSFGPDVNCNRRDTESNCGGGKYTDPGKRKFYGHRIGTKNHAQKNRKNTDEKGKILIIDILSLI